MLHVLDCDVGKVLNSVRRAGDRVGMSGWLILARARGVLSGRGLLIASCWTIATGNAIEFGGHLRIKTFLRVGCVIQILSNGFRCMRQLKRALIAYSARATRSVIGLRHRLTHRLHEVGTSRVAREQRADEAREECCRFA